MTYVFIYKQQKCLFATFWATLNSYIASEKNSIEKVGEVTINIYLSRKTPFISKSSQN